MDAKGASGHSKSYSTAIRHASETWGVRPCCRRLCLDENGVSHAIHECPSNRDGLCGSRERDLFGLCETWSRLAAAPEEIQAMETYRIIVGLVLI